MQRNGNSSAFHCARADPRETGRPQGAPWPTSRSRGYNLPSASAWAALGRVCYSARDYARAVEALSHAVEFGTDDYEVRFTLGQSLAPAARVRRATRDLRSARGGTTHADAWLGRHWCAASWATSPGPSGRCIARRRPGVDRAGSQEHQGLAAGRSRAAGTPRWSSDQGGSGGRAARRRVQRCRGRRRSRRRWLSASRSPGRSFSC